MCESADITDLSMVVSSIGKFPDREFEHHLYWSAAGLTMRCRSRFLLLQRREDSDRMRGRREVDRLGIQRMLADARLGKFDRMLIGIGDRALDEFLDADVIFRSLIARGRGDRERGIESGAGLPCVSRR